MLFLLQWLGQLKSRHPGGLRVSTQQQHLRGGHTQPEAGAWLWRQGQPEDFLGKILSMRILCSLNMESDLNITPSPLSQFISSPGSTCSLVTHSGLGPEHTYPSLTLSAPASVWSQKEQTSCLARVHLGLGLGDWRRDLAGGEARGNLGQRLSLPTEASDASSDVNSSEPWVKTFFLSTQNVMKLTFSGICMIEHYYLES